MPIEIDKDKNNVAVLPGGMTVTCWHGKEENGPSFVLMFYPDGLLPETPTISDIQTLAEQEEPIVGVELPFHIVKAISGWMSDYLEQGDGSSQNDVKSC